MKRVSAFGIGKVSIKIKMEELPEDIRNELINFSLKSSKSLNNDDTIVIYGSIDKIEERGKCGKNCMTCDCFDLCQ